RHGLYSPCGAPPGHQGEIDRGPHSPAQPAPHHRMIVGQQNTNHASSAFAAPIGKRALTAHPRPGAVSTVSVPPDSIARDRIDASPKPPSGPGSGRTDSRSKPTPSSTTSRLT